MTNYDGHLSRSRRAQELNIKWVRILLRSLGYLLLLPFVAVAWFGLLRLGLAPQYIAQFIIELVGPLILLMLLAGAGITFRRWRKDRRPRFLVPLLLTGSAVLASAVTLGSQMAAAWAHGIRVNPLVALWPSSPRLDGSPTRSFVYDRYGEEEAVLHLFRPSSAGPTGAPILVYVHGGGWIQGRSQDRARDMRWFADRGYLVVAVDYALSSGTRHLWNVTQPQIACALAWIERHRARLGGDTGRVVMFGESAGGNLVLNVGNLVNAGRLASRCGGRLPRVSATVSIYPPVDLAALFRHPAATQYPLAYTGGPPARFPERYAALSPIRSAAASNPPTLILTGLDDSLVPVEDTLRYVPLAKAAGAHVELVAIPRAGHGFDLLPGSIGNQIVRGATLRFLAERGLTP